MIEGQEESQLIEGFGNDATVFLGTTTVTLVCFGLAYYKVWFIPQHLREIHAEEREFVDAFRRVSAPPHVS